MALTLRSARRPHARRRSRARSWWPSRRWPSGSCGPSARSATPASPTWCPRRTSCPTGWTRCSRCSTSCSTRATPPAPATHSCAASCAPRRSGWAAVLAALMPDEAEVLGLLALMLLQDSRRDARVDADGAMVLLEDQDRGRWDRAQIEAGLRAVRARAGARARRRVRDPGRDRGRARPRRAAGRTPTGHGSRRCTRCSSGSSPRRWCGSTARRRSRWPRARARASTLMDELVADGARRLLPAAHRARGPAARAPAATTRRRPPTGGARAGRERGGAGVRSAAAARAGAS